MLWPKLDHRIHQTSDQLAERTDETSAIDIAVLESARRVCADQRGPSWSEETTLDNQRRGIWTERRRGDASIRKMLGLVERKAGEISWPTCRVQNLDTFGRNPNGVPRHAEKRWRRDSKGLLCSLGQLGCSDSYSPDTLGTWKFHKVSRAR